MWFPFFPFFNRYQSIDWTKTTAYTIRKDKDGNDVKVNIPVKIVSIGDLDKLTASEINERILKPSNP